MLLDLFIIARPETHMNNLWMSPSPRGYPLINGSRRLIFCESISRKHLHGRRKSGEVEAVCHLSVFIY